VRVADQRGCVAIADPGPNIKARYNNGNHITNPLPVNAGALPKPKAPEQASLDHLHPNTASSSRLALDLDNARPLDQAQIARPSFERGDTKQA
jgi:hypothetical protein